MRILVASSSLFAALMLTAAAALAQASPICLKSSSGMANCVYQTVVQCEQAKGINVAAQCISRFDIVRGSLARNRSAAKRRPDAKPQRPPRQKLSSAQEAPCAAIVHGRCIGRDPDPTVRFMIRHDSSLVND